MTFGWGRWFRWLSGSGDGVRAVGMAWIGLYGMRGKSAGSTCTWSWCVWGGAGGGKCGEVDTTGMELRGIFLREECREMGNRGCFFAASVVVEAWLGWKTGVDCGGFCWGF